MEWLQVIVMVGANLALIVGCFTAMFNLYIHSENKTLAALKEMKEDTQKVIQAIQTETRTLQKEIQNEMKDFHGRLISIEERMKAK